VKFNTPAKQPFIDKVKPMIEEERKNAKVAPLLDKIAAVR
jgi:hypothetical protein